MTDTVPEPQTDDLFDEVVPEMDDPRPWSDLLTGLQVVWGCSRPEARRRAEPYTDGQLEWILCDHWSSRGGS